MNRKTKYYLALFSLATGGCSIYLLAYIRYVFYDQMIMTLDVTNTQLGFLNTIQSSVGLMLLLPKGIIADKFESKNIIIFSLILNSICSFAFATFTTYSMALICWAGLALSTGLGYWPALIKMINSLASADQSARSFGIYYGIYGIAAALINIVEVWAGNMFGFSGAVYVIGTMTVIAAIMDVFLLQSTKSRIISGELEAPKQDGGRDKMKISDIKYVVKWPGFYLLGFTCFFTYMLYANVSYFNPYLVNVIGMPAGISSGLSVIRTYFLMLVCPVGGFFADKVFKSTSKTLAFFAPIIAVMFIIPIFFKPGMNVWVAAVYSLVPSLLVMPIYSIMNSVLRELHVHPLVVGTTVGLSGIFSTWTDMLSPVVFGHWLDKYGNGGYTYIFVALAFCAIGVMLTELLVIRHDKKCKAGVRVMRVE